MKLEWRKQDKRFYWAKNQPSLITVPSQYFIMIEGAGNPNEEAFAEKVGILYQMAYKIKMQYKLVCKTNPELARQNGYDDYTVFPLEGLWTTSDPEHPLDKEHFVYRIMIRQPDFIKKDLFDVARAILAEKKLSELIENISFSSTEEGLCLQMLHRGSFDDEVHSFAKMDDFAKTEGIERLNHWHREIYLTDARKSVLENRKTLLRYQVEGPTKEQGGLDDCNRSKKSLQKFIYCERKCHIYRRSSGISLSVY